MSRPRFKYLQPEDIRRLASYEFAPRFVVEGYMAGRHLSRMRGLSTDFRDYRQYVPGDDPAKLDWKVFARTDRYYIRTYEQETDTVCYIFLDSSASMGFGTELTKLEYSSFFTAALCYLVAKSNNMVSLQIFDEGIRQYFPPGGTSRHMQNLMNALENNHSGAKTSLAAALQRSFPLLRRRGSVIILSDFFDDPAAIFQALSPYLHRGFKVYLIHVLTPEELHLPDRGLAEFIDMENQSRLIAHTESIRDLYEKEIQSHISRIRELSVRRRVAYTVANTQTHYFKLFDWLVK